VQTLQRVGYVEGRISASMVGCSVRMRSRARTRWIAWCDGMAMWIPLASVLGPGPFRR
jgi:hypothetical protein